MECFCDYSTITFAAASILCVFLSTPLDVPFVIQDLPKLRILASCPTSLCTLHCF
ncbi:hypothetical protein BKA83DRAFT_685062 [Pisolithus microcarpus]|nr:hypothetical protein BKA83DRAFT_685062 [Pisolithus microcarpus]